MHKRPLPVLQNRVDQLKASLFKYTEITSGVIPVRTTYIEVGSKIDAQIFCNVIPVPDG